MEWISVDDKLPEIEDKVFVWQKNLVDDKLSRHHCAFYLSANQFNYFDIYPACFHTIYKSNRDFIDYDLEGDKCKITHWMPLPKHPDNA